MFFSVLYFANEKRKEKKNIGHRLSSVTQYSVHVGSLGHAKMIRRLTSQRTLYWALGLDGASSACFEAACFAGVCLCFLSSNSPVPQTVNRKSLAKV